MSWIDDTMSSIAGASTTAAAGTGANDPQVYMGQKDRGMTEWKVIEPGALGPPDRRPGPPQPFGQRGGATEDDVRTVDEVGGLVLAWHGTDEFDRWGKKLLDLGLIDAGDETSVEILDAVWQDSVDLAARFKAAGKNVTPWKAAELLAKSGGSGNGSRYGSSDGAFTGNRSSTSTSVDLTDPATAKAITNDTLSQALGRAARPEELAQFLQVINTAEKTNPTVTTSNTRYDKGEAVSQSSTTSGGLTGAGRSQMVTDRAQALPEYGAFQAASTYFNALVSALDSPV